MQPDAHQKVTAAHLERDAYLYIRQSSLRQVMENTESTRRQYALRDRAVALGWPIERIHVIDSDLGRSGAQVDGREGFQRLSGEVAIGHAGIVMGLEVSRLARNSADWHRLIEICALADTLILDEDGIYNPALFNDRLLLGLKGTMSEAELHVIRTRLLGGLLNKARRGELEIGLPVGLIYDTEGQVVLDPDQQVQSTIRLFFETFRRTGSARATVKTFHEQNLAFPKRIRGGIGKGELLWGKLPYYRALQVLHNPRYAGAFVYGRRQNRKYPDGRPKYVMRPRDQWLVLIQDTHPGYITWEEYEVNLQRLAENSMIFGEDRRAGPPREGPALLQGRVVCGICGERMLVRYRTSKGKRIPTYICQLEAIRKSIPLCQIIPGEAIDNAIGNLLVEMITPMTLEVSLSVQQELDARFEEADRLHRLEVERARFEAELARRRYMRVDPDNRLVADSLEAEWNEKLRALKRAQGDYEREREVKLKKLDEETRTRILALAKDFSAVWNDPRTPHRERKRMFRLLVEDVILIRRENITAHVRFRGGATHTLYLPLPLTMAQIRKIKSDIVEEIDRLLDKNYSYSEIAENFNQEGRRTWEEKPFTAKKIAWIRYAYRLKSPYQRLRDKGFLTVKEMAEKLEISPCTVHAWRRQGILHCQLYSDVRSFSLYEPPDYIRITKGRGGRPPIVENVTTKPKTE